MKITAVDTCVLEIPTTHQMPLQYPRHRMVLAEVKTDEGINGLGYSLLFNGLGDGPVHEYLERHLKPLLTGEDPAAIDHLWTAMSAPQVPAAQRRAQAYAVAAADIALWDIAGQAAGRPLGRMWAPSAPACPATAAAAGRPTRSPT